MGHNKDRWWGTAPEFGVPSFCFSWQQFFVLPVLHYLGNRHVSNCNNWGDDENTKKKLMERREVCEMFYPRLESS